MAIEFIECTSLSVSYDVLGRATVTYTMVHDTPKITVVNELSAGGQTFRGYITNAFMSAIPRADGWYETNATLISTTN